MTVNSYLTNLASSLVLIDDEKISIDTSIRALENRLDLYFGERVIEQHRFGSSTRGTILPRKADENSDIDYMIVFNTKESTYKPQTYLNYLKDFAEKYYSFSEIHQSNPVVVLELNHIKFDLVPARKEEYYYSGSVYYIPSPSNYLMDWITTDPWKYEKDLVSKNAANNYKIKPLIRIIKYWNSLINHQFNSFDLENYTANALYLFCDSLSEFFYSFWKSIQVSSSWNQLLQEKVSFVKREVMEIKDLENQGDQYSAEVKIKKLLPEV